MVYVSLHFVVSTRSVKGIAVAGPQCLVLGDRPVQLTMLRAWEWLWWWPKVKLLLGLLWSCTPFGKPKEDVIRKFLLDILESAWGGLAKVQHLGGATAQRIILDLRR